jgi:hypothetical protein
MRPLERRAAAAPGVALALATLALSACSPKDNGTLLAVRVDTDFAVPGQIDTVAIDVHPQRGAASTDTFKVSGRGSLPVTLGLRPKGDPNFGMDVTARGMLGSKLVLGVTATVQFTPGEAREFTLFLSSDCSPTFCPKTTDVCLKGPRCVAKSDVAQTRPYVSGGTGQGGQGGTGGQHPDASAGMGGAGAGGAGGTAGEPVDASPGEARPNPGTWISVPGVPPLVSLSAVWPFTPTSVWVAGAQAAGVILHYDGMTWMPAAVPAGTPALYGLWASAPSDLWAVGANGTVLHLGATNAWMASKAPTMPGVPEPTLSAIWGAAANDIWVVGSGGTIFHTDGASGLVAETSNVTAGLFAVGGSAMAGGAPDVWAVGASGTILHRTSTGWAPAAQGMTQSILYAVWSDDPSDVWVAGDKTVLHWNGSTWKPVTGSVDVSLAIWGSAGDDIWTVGRASAAGGATIARWDGLAFTTSPDASGSTLQAVRGFSPTDVWAAGANGAVFRFQPQ